MRFYDKTTTIGLYIIDMKGKTNAIVTRETVTEGYIDKERIIM